MPRIGRGKFPDGDGSFSKAPNVNFNDDQVKTDANDVDNANENFGSASGFVPKSFLIQKKVSLRIPFVLSCRYADPASEHPSDFVDDFLKDDVFLRVERSRLLHEANHEAENIELDACFLKDQGLPHFIAIACLHEKLHD